jgi:signal-transduction protein with cAMP-binding, CBS, and nucleotidyltransferase domain
MTFVYDMGYIKSYKPKYTIRDKLNRLAKKNVKKAGGWSFQKHVTQAPNQEAPFRYVRVKRKNTTIPVDESDGLCIILDGFVDVVDEGEVISTLGRGDCFGDRNLYSHIPKGIENLGDLVAKTNVRLFIIPSSYFYRIPNFELKKIKRMAQSLSKREQTEMYVKQRRQTLERRKQRGNKYF